MSIEALRMPVVIRSLRSGSFSITARGKPVRSRMAQTIWNPCSALTTLSGAAEVLVEHLDVEVARDFRPVRHLERDVLEIVEDCTAILGHVVLFLMRVRAGGSLGTARAGRAAKRRLGRKAVRSGRNRALTNAKPAGAAMGPPAGQPSPDLREGWSQPLMRARPCITGASTGAAACLARHFGPGPRM